MKSQEYVEYTRGTLVKSREYVRAMFDGRAED